ncbi:MAG: hypothetical protein HDT27_04950 [Subdoligranulum sp.]|nr:hypothetical protein [Subdoligranulum sp.]
MAKFVVKGIEEYALKVSKLGDQTERVAKKAIYEAAAIITDEIRKNIDGIPVQNGTVPKGEMRKGIPEPAKEGLQQSFGITKIDKDREGVYNAKIGFDGYNDIKTKRWPQGQPNQMIARSVESGTSFMAPHPFIAPAVRKTKAAALKKMSEVIDEETKKIMG